MIKINTKTLKATREPLPANVKGLDDETLRNLQAVLKPVPPDLINVEFWPETDDSLPIDDMTQKYGDEEFTVDSVNKTVSVVRQILPLSSEEIAAKQAVIDAGNNRRVKSELDAMTIAALPDFIAHIAATGPQALKDKAAEIAAKKGELK